MAYSMTGFGKAACEHNGAEVSVEVSAVNHRFLDCSIRLPYSWSALEPVVRETLKKHLARGKISVNVSRKWNGGSSQMVQLDRELAKQYIAASEELGLMLGTYEKISADTLAQLDGVFFQSDPDEELEQTKAMITGVLVEALERLQECRAVEGATLIKEIAEQVGLIRDSLNRIEERLPGLNEQHMTRLRERITELAGDVSIAEERIAVEVAILADKGDVTEEVVRLKSHLARMDELLESAEPIGRETNFLAQEIQREMNTLGVKVRDTDVVREVLSMKSELEKIREQIQNIE